MTTNDPISLPLRLDVDRRAVRENLWLRATAASVTILCSVWLTATQDHWSLALVGALTGGFAIVWLIRGLRDHARALQGDQHVLLDNIGITHQHAGNAIHVGWGNVVTVDVDEDRLLVNIECDDRPALHVEPNFGGLGVYQLHAVITGAWITARSCASDATSASPIERA